MAEGPRRMDAAPDCPGAFNELARLIFPEGRCALPPEGTRFDGMTRLVEAARTWIAGAPPPVGISVVRNSTNLIALNGDAVLGFVLLPSSAPSERVEVRVLIGSGGAEHPPVSLPPIGEGIAFAFCGRFAIPLLCLRFCEVRLIVTPMERSTDVGTVFACFDSAERRVIAQTGCYARVAEGEVVQFGSGFMHNPAPVPEPTRARVELPDMRQLCDARDDATSRVRSIARNDALLGDLMAATWHPRRVRAWCLDAADEFALHPDDAVEVLDAFMTPSECAAVAAALGRPPEPPRLVDAPAFVLGDLASRLNRAVPRGAPWSANGTRVAFGDTAAGLASHRDESYEGGAATLLVYLACPEGAGGDTVFASGQRVTPRVGRAALFSVNHEHRAIACRGRKVVLACEVTGTGVFEHS